MGWGGRGGSRVLAAQPGGIHCAEVSIGRSVRTEPHSWSGARPGPTPQHQARLLGTADPALESEAMTATVPSAAVESPRSSEGTVFSRGQSSESSLEGQKPGQVPVHTTNENSGSGRQQSRSPQGGQRGAVSRRGTRSTSSGPGSYTWSGSASELSGHLHPSGPAPRTEDASCKPI